MIDPSSWLVEDMLRVEELLLATAGASGHPTVAEASTHLIKAGGKRLRPALVMISSRAGEPGRRATDLAAGAVELVHLATLYHDDVIDETDTRRGVPTVHSKWGTEVAVLAGDYLFACGCNLGAQAGDEVPGILALAIAEVCEGQIVETGALGDARRTTDDYLDTISHKTAALFRASCELGAATSEASREARAALVAYGLNVGIAFQIVDDLLDLVGDQKMIGKLPGTDLREGVFTLPVLMACAREPAIVRRLSEGERDLSNLLPAIEGTGAITDAHEAARNYGAAARRSLEALPESEWRDSLDTIVTGVLAQV